MPRDQLEVRRRASALRPTRSTTLRCRLGLVTPTSGSVTIGGSAYAALRDPLLQVGALLEASDVHPGRSGRDHLGLAAAMLGDPQVLLLDEPANGLDPEGVRWLRGFLRALAAQGRTVLVSSHVLAEVQQTVDDVVVIAFSQLVEPLLRVGLGVWSATEEVSRYLPGAAADALAGGSIYTASGGADLLEPAQGGLALAAHALVLAGLGVLTTRGRDVAWSSRAAVD